MQLTLLALVALQGARDCGGTPITSSSDFAFQAFGTSFALDGDVVLVGAPGTNLTPDFTGLAFVFERGDGSWPEVASLGPADLVLDDEFGRAVSLDGDTAVVSAPLQDVGTMAEAGALYVFDRIAGAWTQTAKLTASDPALGDRFGMAVSIDGDTLLVGKPRDSAGGFQAGAVYVFDRTGTTWTETVKLTASDAAPISNFGMGVGLSGDTAFVTAPRDDGGGTSSGAAYFFERRAGVWSEDQKVLSPEPAANAFFGAAADFDSGQAVITATVPGAPIAAAHRVFVFEKVGTSWTATAELASPQAPAMDAFGNAVAIAAGTVAVQSAEVVYAFREIGAGWNVTNAFSLPDGTFGGVALDGTSVVAAEAWPTFGTGRVFDFASSCPGFAACFGSGCPCGNDDVDAGCASSTGSGALLGATGTASIAADDLQLVATGCPPGNTGLFFAGSGLLEVPVNVGDGLSCVGLSSFRYYPGVVDGAGVFVHDDVITGAPPGFIQAGDTRVFQAWTRDVLCGPPPAPCPSACGNNNNLTSAYVVTFLP